VPALADRLEDIPALAQHFARDERGAPLTVARDAIALLQAERWPGNVRELKHVMEVASAFAVGSIDARTLSAVLAGRDGARAADAPAASSAERRSLIEVLERSAWDADDAAKLLGIHRATLYRRMKRLAVVAPHATVAPSRGESRGSGATNATGFVN